MKRLLPALTLCFALAACSDDPRDPNLGASDAGEETQNHPHGPETDSGLPALDAQRDPDDVDSPHPDTGHPDPGHPDTGHPDTGHPDTDTNPSPSCDPVDAPMPDWYVSTTGTNDGAGTETDPLSLSRALASNSPVRAGDLVYLKAGTYVGRFDSRVAGSSNNPIVFAAAPGARVTLDSNASDAADGSTLTINGAWVEFHGLEITNTSPDRDTHFVDGVTIYGANTKLVNSVIHDTAQGISFWSNAVDSELYGNIIYNNGFEGPSRGHGHAIYTQNNQGTKRIANNIIFFGYGYGIHAYTEGGSIQGFDIIDNVWFRAGASRPGASREGTSDGCLVGGLQPVDRTRLIGNHSWGPTTGARSTRLGWGGSVENEHITLLDNYFVGAVTAQGHWKSAQIEGNTFYSALSGMDPADWPDNLYPPDAPTGTKVVVQPNAYDTTRIDLILYNFDEADTIPVELTGHLPVGASYAIYSVFDLWGAPVTSGTFDGAPVAVPMGTKPPAQPNGDPNAITGADDPRKSFGVFVLRMSC